MQLSFCDFHCPKFVLALFFPLFACILLGGPTGRDACAAEQNTAFVPFRINAPDAREMTALVDEALQRDLAGREFAMLDREEAGTLLDYAGAWPPDLESIERIAERTGYDYVAVGSLTRLADQLSIDIQVFDILTPGAVHSSYRDAMGIAELDSAIRDTVSDILGFTSRTYLISSIAPAGNVRIDSGAILRKITTRPGDLYDPAQLREDLKAVFSMGYFDNVEIIANDTDKGKEIIFQVKEKPVIKRVLIGGTDAISEQDVRDAATIAPNTILNPTRLNEAVQRINDLYKSKGFYNTQTTVSISYPSEDSAEVQFTIDEGKKVFIGKILFEGNKSFSNRELQKVIETSTRGWLSWITDTGVLKMDMLQQDTAKIGAFYSNNGFLEAKVGEPTVEQVGDELVITFHIEEGPRFRVGTVDIRGDLIESKEELIARLKIRDEEYLNRQVLRNDNLMLTDLYAEHGYAFAEARPKVERAPDSNRVDIVLDIDHGPLVYFNRVEIRGNTRTRDNVIRRDLEVAEGGVFNSRAVRESTENLNRLGFFEEVSITPEPTMNEDRMDVVVDVKEQSTGQFSIGAGYSSADNLLFMAEISENNLMGTGNRLALAANLSSVTTRFNLSYTDPRIFDTKVLAGFDLFNWMREYDDYTKETWGGGVRLGHPLFEKWRISYGYTYADTDLTDVAENASIIIKRSQDIHVTSSVRVVLSRDTRNRFYDATEGSVNVVSVEYAGGPFGGDAEFTKLEGSTSWLFPLPLDSVFHIKGAAGQIFENEDDKLPVYEHFYLGGLNSIRGFKSSYVSPKDPVTDERIGGDKMWYTNIEVIFPLFKEMGLKGVVFVDFGNVYDVEEDWEFDKIKKAIGLGFRWLSPMGPLRLEWGYNLDPDPDDDTSVWDFSIGGVF
ncbi:MAG TPA: outer membrane protein assembly factor BamA [Desulfobacteraceae bacterium]|nr:outer membrane protein assembly factor BamA [Desulfobacteraceae bacterium]